MCMNPAISGGQSRLLPAVEGYVQELNATYHVVADPNGHKGSLCVQLTRDMAGWWGWWIIIIIIGDVSRDTRIFFCVYHVFPFLCVHMHILISPFCWRERETFFSSSPSSQQMSRKKKRNRTKWNENNNHHNEWKQSMTWLGLLVLEFCFSFLFENLPNQIYISLYIIIFNDDAYPIPSFRTCTFPYSSPSSPLQFYMCWLAHTHFYNLSLLFLSHKFLFIRLLFSFFVSDTQKGRRRQVFSPSPFFESPLLFFSFYNQSTLWLLRLPKQRRPWPL